MNKMSKKIIAGIITLIIFLSGGTIIYIQDLGTKTGCHAGWVYEDVGEHEGYYKCLTQSNVRYEICFDVYNSSNTENYWCKKGLIIENPTIEKTKDKNVCLSLGYKQELCEE